MSSSGLVPFSFSNRVLKEYGVSASTPESLERLPLPARPVPRQTAFALRIMEHSLYWFGSIPFGYGCTCVTDQKMTRQYLEDDAVGQVYRSGRLRVDRDQLIAFAAQFDPQPYHLDEEAARKSNRRWPKGHGGGAEGI